MLLQFLVLSFSHLLLLKGLYTFLKSSSLFTTMDLLYGGPLRFPPPITSVKEASTSGKSVRFSILPPSSFTKSTLSLKPVRRPQRITAESSSTINPPSTSNTRGFKENQKAVNINPGGSSKQQGKHVGTEQRDCAKQHEVQIRIEPGESLREATEGGLHVVSKPSKDRDARVALLQKSVARVTNRQTEEKNKKRYRGQWLLEQIWELVHADSGSPGWYCPLDAGGFPENAPLFLCLPDIISNGLSSTLHQEKLARLFEVRCLHVPFKDDSTNEDLLKLVEVVIREEQTQYPSRTIYLMGEGYGALLAFSLAARNPDVDLVLVLVDPATWCDNHKILPPLLSMLEASPGPVSSMLPFLLSSTLGDPVTIAKATVNSSLPPLERTKQFASALQDLLQILATATVSWGKERCQQKVDQLKKAARSANWQLKMVNANVLLLASGKEQNANEAKRLQRLLPSCTVRFFKDTRPALLLEEGVELASLIKATNMYRHSKPRSLCDDYVPPSEDEREMFRKVHIATMKQLFSPVFFTVGENGLLERGIPVITRKRPVLFICNHTFVGFDLGVIINEFMESQNVMIRSLAHPLITKEIPGEVLPASGMPDLVRLLGGVPVTGNNLYKLMAAHEAVLLLPGGMREAVKRKGEAYKLIWPKKAEFVRTAIRHGAVIIPLAAVGGDDFIQILLDQQETLQFPVIGERLHSLAATMPRARSPNNEGDDGHILGTLGFPKPPPRMYFAFQKPIYTDVGGVLAACHCRLGEGDGPMYRERQAIRLCILTGSSVKIIRAVRQHVSGHLSTSAMHDQEFPHSLKDREAVDNLYQQVKSELEDGLAYLLKKRGEDPYQNFVPRLVFEKTWGRQAPTFKL